MQDGSSASMAQDGSSALPPPPPPPLPEPAGRLDLTVERIALAAGGSTGELFFVIKCGPHWARSTALPLAGGSSVEYGWQLSLPVLDPCSVLTLAVFQQSRPKRGLDKARPGFLPSTVQVRGAMASCKRFSQHRMLAHRLAAAMPASPPPPPHPLRAGCGQAAGAPVLPVAQHPAVFRSATAGGEAKGGAPGGQRAADAAGQLRNHGGRWAGSPWELDGFSFGLALPPSCAP